MDCKVVFTSEVKCQLQGLTLEDKKVLYNKYSFFVPSARFSPLYKLGRWNGKVYYFTEGASTYVSLLPEIIHYLQQRGYNIIYESYFQRKEFNFPEIDEHYLNNIKWFKGHKLEGQPVEMFDHQVKAVNALLKSQHGIAQVATSGGKTLISLALAKAVLPYGKFIIIEPTTDLTLQTADFYKNLGFKCGIVGLGKREFDNDIIVATWQTLLSLDRRGKKKNAKLKDILSLEDLESLKKDVVALAFDECHLVAANEIFKILSDQFKEVPLRWGLTGTVPKGKEEYYPLICGIGSVVVSVDSKELQDKGVLAQSNITILSMKDDAVYKEYDEEFKYLASDPDKIIFEAKIIAQASNAGNTLVLVQRLETGKKLVKVLKEMLDKDAVFLSGKDKSEIRMEEYKAMQEGNNKIIIATAQIASTGLDIPRIFNMIYIDMGKSFVKTIQSIGRGLRTYTDKNKVQVFDICSSTKFSKRHMKERIKYYIEKEHPWQMINIEQWKETDEQTK